MTIRSGRVTTADFALEPGALGELAGTVTDEAGAPLAGVTVAIPSTPLEPVTTGPDGRFRLDVVEGTYELTATLAGYAPFATAVTITAGATTDVDVDTAAVRDRRHR